jgi:hypothetical protein
VTEAAETAAGRTALVVAAEPIGITTYDAGGDHRHHRCPCGVAMADVMMIMAGEKGGEAMVRRRRGDGEATARRRRGDGEATARRRRGDHKATERQQGCKCNQLWRRRWQGQGGNQQEDNKYYLITNQTFAIIFFASFPHDTKVTSTANEMAFRT